MPLELQTSKSSQSSLKNIWEDVWNSIAKVPDYLKKCSMQL